MDCLAGNFVQVMLNRRHRPSFFATIALRINYPKRGSVGILKFIFVALASAMLLAECGSVERQNKYVKNLTNEQVEYISSQEAIALLNCQMEKAVDELGQQEFLERYADGWKRNDGEEGDTLQVIWWNDGYRCEELLR